MDVSLVNAMSWKTVHRQYLDTLRGQYSHIPLSCQPSRRLATINALAASRLVILVQAEDLPSKGLEQLLKTVAKVKQNISPQFQIEGILLTMVDSRTNLAWEISQLIRDTYGRKILFLDTAIPCSSSFSGSGSDSTGQSMGSGSDRQSTVAEAAALVPFSRVA